MMNGIEVAQDKVQWQAVCGKGSEI